VTWRSIAFLPMMLGMFLFLLVHVSGLFMLPIIGGACFLFGLWQYGVILALGWLLLFWSWRHFRLREHFRSPPSVL
jgi:hypothetical protein